jgi:hypothetical protein
VVAVVDLNKKIKLRQKSIEEIEEAVFISSKIEDPSLSREVYMAGKAALRALTSSNTHTYRTPPEIIKKIEGCIGKFTHDAAAGNEHVSVANIYTPTLVHSLGCGGLWKCSGTWHFVELEEADVVWCNPFDKKEILEPLIRAQKKIGFKLAMLLPVTPGTAMWQELLMPECAILFMKGRVKFLMEDGTPEKACSPFAVALLFLGVTADELYALQESVGGHLMIPHKYGEEA